MPHAEKPTTKENLVSFESRRYQANWPGSIACLVFALLITVAVGDYRSTQSYHVTTHPTDTNLVGIVGAEYAFDSYWLLGTATWLVPAYLFWMSFIYARSARHLTGTRFLAMALSIIALASLLGMQDWFFMDHSFFASGPGGKLGNFIYGSVLKDSIGVFGSGLILSTVYVVGLLFVFTRDIGKKLEQLAFNISEWRKKRAAFAKEERTQRKEQAKQKTVAAALTSNTTATKSDSLQAFVTPKNIITHKGANPFAEPALAKWIAAPTQKPAPAAPEPTPAPVFPETTGTGTKLLVANAARKFEINIVKAEETKKAKVALQKSDDKTYEFPPLNLLKEQVHVSATDSEEEHRQNAENLLRILSDFGVEVSLGEIHVGPVITRYEVVPAPGVRVEKISGLDKNIALGMRAQSVRILAPIPGKAAVGVEVPNQNPTPVGMREILESEDWASNKAELPIALGKDVSGKPLVSDLTKMPHLLIAGATGSGKSVCINSIVASILYSKSPTDVRLIMVDPKVVELKTFNSLPHMLIPVVTEPKKVPAALKWLLGEMEKRYQIFAKVNVRNILGFKDKQTLPPPKLQPQLARAGFDDIDVPNNLPYIVAIIDELADLMMVAPAEIETSIARLAQLARAAGIHLIIATQRPSVNVITGVIKANLPSRIAFQVASQVDSRTILDTKGADTLIGRGDMLFSPPGSSRLVRAQGAFVADEEVHSIVNSLKRNGPPQYAQSVQQQIDRTARENEDDNGGRAECDLGNNEELFMQAFDVLKSTRRASTSMMQRRLRIGYNRAARIMELMEDKGIVGPENGSNPRDILVDLDTYQL